MCDDFRIDVTEDNYDKASEHENVNNNTNCNEEILLYRNIVLMPA